MFLVGAGSGLVLTLAAVFKDILLITGSVLIFGSLITPLQVFGAYSLFCLLSVERRICVTDASATIGYSIALAGLVLYKTSGSK